MTSLLKISEGASLALHSMIILARAENELLSVKNISDELAVSANHLSKIMQRLVKCGLVMSIKGNGGGFKLAKNPAKITLLNIYEAIDGKFKPSSCLLHGDKSCMFSECVLGDLLSSVNSQVELHFKNKTLDSFIS